MNQIKSTLWSLGKNDYLKGLIVVVFVTILAAVQEALTTHGLDIQAYDWAGIADLAWKAGTAYLFKQLMTDDSGKVLGKI